MDKEEIEKKDSPKTKKQTKMSTNKEEEVFFSMDRDKSKNLKKSGCKIKTPDLEIEATEGLENQRKIVEYLSNPSPSDRKAAIYLEKMKAPFSKHLIYVVPRRPEEAKSRGHRLHVSLFFFYFCSSFMVYV